jgi:hypothetical protein
MRYTMMALAAAAMLVGGTASAKGPVNARQLNQERRIDAGRRSGKLTQHERDVLYAEQHAIQRLAAQLKARHGKLTDADKRLIHARQNAADRHILGQKSDRQRGKNHLKL